MKSRPIPLAGIFLLVAGTGSAGTVCPDSSYVEVHYACSFTGSYRSGEPLDIVTVAPNGNGDTFAQNGISIRVFLRDCDGNPVADVPAESITLTHPLLCICQGGNIADGPTDASGSTTFSGALVAGGCAPNLILQVNGIEICTVPVKTNSPDNVFGLPCNVSADEIALLVRLLGGMKYNFCMDFDKNGIYDQVDWAIFVNRYYGSWCTEWGHP